jgi:alkylation response protein AidB-like acyl-CoA dehydrogenase
MLAGPTILNCGTDDQKGRYLPPIVRGESMWCQLFSEPGAGSDLASLRTTARPVRGGWRVSGQKVWTSNGHLADMGMLLARTGGSPGRAGISWIAIEMDQPGVAVRPLREMTGRSLFNEVFLDDAFVAGDAVVGGVGGGWKAARVTLEHERGGLAEGSGAVGGMPGERAGQLELSAAVIAARLGGAKRTPSGTAMAMRGRVFEAVLAKARALGMTADPVVRQSLARLHTLESLTRYDAAARHPAGGPATASLAKLRYTTLVRAGRDLVGALGPGGC